MNIDISNKLGKAKPTLTIAEGKTYEVDNSAENVLLMQSRINGEEMDIDAMYSIIDMLMGENALDDIKKMKPSINEIQTIITAIMALVQEIPLEDAEKRFQNVVKEQ